MGLKTVNTEMAMYSSALSRKPQIVVLNKMDLPGTEHLAKKFESAAQEKSALRISAVIGLGITELKSQIINLLDDFHE
jgi:GTP-binding protein